MKAQCVPSIALWRLLLYFLTLPVPILVWPGHSAAELWTRHMAAFQGGCAREREGERVHWGLQRDSHALSLIQAARLSFFTICSVCLVLPFWY